MVGASLTDGQGTPPARSALCRLAVVVPRQLGRDPRTQVRGVAPTGEQGEYPARAGLGGERPEAPGPAFGERTRARLLLLGAHRRSSRGGLAVEPLREERSLD